MAISAALTFKKKPDQDARKDYDAVVDEMGVRDNPAPGLIYHWCAGTPDGLQICDVWESAESFEKFAKEKIGPITAKHGLDGPAIEITPVHETIEGTDTSHGGTGVFVDFDGNARELLAKIDDANARMQINGMPPEGLIFHCATERANGVRIIDHWRSREDFDRFVETTLSPVLKDLVMPAPRILFFEVYNTIGRRPVRV